MSRRRQQTASRRFAWIPLAACGDRVEADETGRAQDASGVRRRARSESRARNRRGPTWQPTSGEGGAYKPKAKRRRAGRESEGFVVPARVGAKTPPEGRDPTLVVPAIGGKCEGMAARPNNPNVKARKLQSKLFVSAKRYSKWLSASSIDPRPAVTGWQREGCGSFGLRACGMRKPSVSRVRENRMHGLTGGHRSPGPQGYRA